MKIIVEGPDGSGKSTLIARLTSLILSKNTAAKQNGLVIDHLRAKPATEAALPFYLDRLLRTKTPTIFDRFHLSEVIYSPILRGALSINAEEQDLIQRVAAAVGAKMILCLPDFETTLKNVSKEGRPRPSYQTELFLRTSHANFEDEVQFGEFIVYDYTQDPDAVELLPRLGL